MPSRAALKNAASSFSRQFPSAETSLRGAPRALAHRSVFSLRVHKRLPGTYRAAKRRLSRAGRLPWGVLRERASIHQSGDRMWVTL
jgi:hypothetical protein